MANNAPVQRLSREALIYRALRDDTELSAKALMNRAGLSWRTDPVSSFASLCISVSKLNRMLVRSQRQILRTGGTPDDFYLLSPIGDG
jgi:hypothetical protein